jgi:2-polyprenyl-3-methyl-5-hydroxy-6-metoxy-1,4-benzoquinol methylase
LSAVLDAAWITQQLAWESLWTTLSAGDALRLTRSHLADFLERAIPVGASVIDLRKDSGVASRLVAKSASAVLDVDISTANVGIGRKECEGLGNGSFEIGEALEVLRARGPFDVALMLHVLGFEEDPVASLGMVCEWARSCCAIL